MSESGLRGHQDDALSDLLVKQVTDRLSSAEQRELDTMDSSLVSRELDGFERAAAALMLAGTAVEEPPAALRALLERQADGLLAASKVVDFKPAPPAPATAPPAPTAAAPVHSAAPRGGAWGWLAAAACLALAVLGWMRSPAPLSAPGPMVALQPPPAVLPQPEPAPPPTPAEQRTAMLGQPDAVKVTLGATKDPAALGVTGDAVWNPASQQGFLHFVGLASNDPSVRQYQIWVFDGSRDKRYPVNGGVFDVPAGASEVVIPIHASLPIGQVKAFAVTVEKPGGVVVSGLGHVVALGAAG